MVRLAKALLTVAAIIAVACAVAPPPRVVTVITPHVSILPLDVAKNPGLNGRVLCDLQGYPVIFIRMGMPEHPTRWTVVHERVHAEQAFAHRGGCIGLRTEMSQDSMFRLAMESAAFCGVFSAQKATGDQEDPDRDEIFRLLSERYGAAYDSATVTSAMVLCGRSSF